MVRLLISYCLLATVVAWPARAWAGAWLAPPGSSYTKAAWIYQRADERWGCRGGTDAADPGGDYVQHQAFLYTEVGVREWLTVLGSYAYKDQRIDGMPEFGTRSTGDLRVGARLPLLKGPKPVSVETVLSFPTYERSNLSDPVSERAQFLPAGSGRMEGEIHLLAGASLWPLPFYGNLDLGYRERGGPYDDQWLLGLEAGAGGESLFAKAEFRWTLPLDEDCSQAAIGAVAVDERSVVFSPEVAARAWISLGLSQPLSGRNALQGPVWTFGLIRRLEAGGS